MWNFVDTCKNDRLGIEAGICGLALANPCMISFEEGQIHSATRTLMWYYLKERRGITYAASIGHYLSRTIRVRV